MIEFCFKIENNLQFKELEKLSKNELKGTRLNEVLNRGSYKYGLFYLYVSKFLNNFEFAYSSYEYYERRHPIASRIKDFHEFKNKILVESGYRSVNFMTKKIITNVKNKNRKGECGRYDYICQCSSKIIFLSLIFLIN